MEEVARALGRLADVEERRQAHMEAAEREAKVRADAYRSVLTPGVPARSSIGAWTIVFVCLGFYALGLIHGVGKRGEE